VTSMVRTCALVLVAVPLTVLWYGNFRADQDACYVSCHIHTLPTLEGARHRMQCVCSVKSHAS